jgi:putative oxidoreductase
MTLRALSVLRVVSAFLFMAHGTQKLFAMPVNQARNPVDLLSLSGAAGMLEVFGGALLLVGLFTRPVAFILSGEMAVAYFLVHQGMGPLPVVNMGERSVLFCFSFLYMSSRNSGPLSLDALMGSKK